MTETTPTPCYEVVHFAFRDGVDTARQHALMQALGAWAASQPGFVGRQAFLDRSARRWTDIVEWRGEPEARAAMERAAQEPALAAAMAAIAPEGFSIGHAERVAVGP